MTSQSEPWKQRGCQKDWKMTKGNNIWSYQRASTSERIVIELRLHEKLSSFRKIIGLLWTWKSAEKIIGMKEVYRL